MIFLVQTALSLHRGALLPTPSVMFAFPTHVRVAGTLVRLVKLHQYWISSSKSPVAQARSSSPMMLQVPSGSVMRDALEGWVTPVKLTEICAWGGLGAVW